MALKITINEPDIELNKILSSWYAARERLSALKEEEGDLRRKIVARFTGSDPFEDIRVDYCGDKISIDRGLEHKVDAKVADGSLFEALVAHLTGEQNPDPEGNAQSAVDRLIRFKPELNLKVYNALAEDDPYNIRPVVEEFVTSKPSSPQVKVKAAQDSD